MKWKTLWWGLASGIVITTIAFASGARILVLPGFVVMHLVGVAVILLIEALDLGSYAQELCMAARIKRRPDVRLHLRNELLQSLVLTSSAR